MNAVAQKEQQNVSRIEERNYVAPPVRIFETDEGYVLEADMPGVSKEGLEITMEGSVLTVVGHRAGDGAPQNATEVYRESRQADYRRSFELDPGLESEKISAKIEQGLLVVNLPKPQRVKPRKIEVAAE